ncbi:hypothetical protein GCM10007939_02680 [Amylibacter marinus]|uniref:Uncharacterized protein n=1 Tax=Amylibacter marinus TaxID=1475483 RepID=A0ABQ5VRQ0_9RHOB|nr:hypothetical protein [Amylibacter marinus]GLQ33985.1 hypothetical protein GCM10007939_02680 [Amylibacter marinus]
MSDRFGLRGKHALEAGANTGIGLAIARILGAYWYYGQEISDRAVSSTSKADASFQITALGIDGG